ncbi:MAG: Cthe_2314 family HEPN domain-containing protein [Promethearchaeota archaeon]
MSDKDLLDSLFYRLSEIMKSEGIQHISEIKIDNKHPLTFYSEIIDNSISKKKPPLFLYDDFFFLSNDLIHFTLLLFLLRPFINDPRKEKGTYFQNWYDARYLSYSGVLHSTVYNFWDRIGDLLNCFFNTGLSENSVYIGRVISNFPIDCRDSKYFQHLEEIYSQKIRHLILQRNEDAHNQLIITGHYFNIVLAKGEDQLEKAELKFSLPEIFKEQINLAHTGFELALRLIKEKRWKS